MLMVNDDGGKRPRTWRDVIGWLRASSRWSYFLDACSPVCYSERLGLFAIFHQHYIFLISHVPLLNLEHLHNSCQNPRLNTIVQI